MVGRITRVPLREVWKHEALDFTTWLEQNIEVLSEVLGFGLQNAERERSAGDFAADLVAEDDGGRVIVIENQLGKSDHDHLGKLITYLSVLSARVAVWLVSDPRPEHIQAVAWLNESRLVDFYLLKVEAIRIGESEPAPLLTVITRPSEQVREVGDKTKEIAERHALRFRFWETLLDRAKAKTKLFAHISPNTTSGIKAGAGKTGLSFQYLVRQHDASVELVIDQGKDSEVENKTTFEQLKTHQNEIEGAFGSPLYWYQEDDVRACRIGYQLDGGGYRTDEAHWPEIEDRMIDSMIRLENALQPFLGKESAPVAA